MASVRKKETKQVSFSDLDALLGTSSEHDTVPTPEEIEPQEEPSEPISDTPEEVESDRNAEIERIINENHNAAKADVVFEEQMLVVPSDELALSLGWQPINSVSRSGLPVRLTDDPNKKGSIYFWRKTRAFANATHRWEETGYWTESVSGMKCPFVPLYWKDRHAV